MEEHGLGRSWDKVDSFPASDGGNGVGIPIVAFRQGERSKGKPTPVIYAAVANKDGSLYRSTDAGATWKLVPKQPKGVMASHAEFDSTGVLYISYGNGPGPNDVTDGSVWKYQPKQEKFTNITPAGPEEGRHLRLRRAFGRRHSPRDRHGQHHRPLDPRRRGLPDHATAARPGRRSLPRSCATTPARSTSIGIKPQ